MWCVHDEMVRNGWSVFVGWPVVLVVVVVDHPKIVWMVGCGCTDACGVELGAYIRLAVLGCGVSVCAWKRFLF